MQDGHALAAPAPDLGAWVGRSQLESDEATLAPPLALNATIDSAEQIEEGSFLPPLWHWLYFLPRAQRSMIGPDGHPKRGGFLPPVTLPRRMWAGSKLIWNGEIRIGEKISRKSTIESVESKSGRSGNLVFVRVRHEVGNGPGTPAIVEWQDIVYRESPSSPSQTAAPQKPAEPAPDAAWREEWRADPVLLFRFSALTFNAHRIHYDRPYATNEEGYRGLVVHGPLLAVLMMQLSRSRMPGRTVREFQFRGVSPLIDLDPFEVCGNPEGEDSAALYVRTKDGVMTTQGSVTFGD